MSAIIDLQLATTSKVIPTLDNVQLWLDTVLLHQNLTQQEITVRIVDIKESQALNCEFRGKDSPTNVLSFPFEMPDIVFQSDVSELDEMPAFLGDLVICSQVVETEAKQQNKQNLDHWAHMIIHGCLHLLGFDHIEEAEANEMEAIEIAILKQLSIDDPYQDH
ncbi:rRNA maturation RNase YbeY [uncultured Paraglaciecola sp.]|uniref:rRNA maturation RNase YbeY n=1 Tax=uncultured Paraglaciecola sp. TaxID=1765024 RepID=UPI0025964AA5|nr:rRNA maturation RNase YbeY [uncultured Paraglaciecola sp.]